MDAIDVQILQCLIVDGRMPLRHVGVVVGVSEQTVARRYRAMRDAGQVRVRAVRSGFVATRRAWTVHVRCRPDSAARLAEALAARDDTGWVSLVSGGNEIVCATSAPVASTDDGVLSRLPHTGAVLSFSAQAMLRSFSGASDAWTVFETPLTREPPARWRSDDATTRPPRRADALTEADAPLADALARDGRATATQLSKELGWPASRVAARLEALLGSALYLLTDHLPESFGYHTSAYLRLTVGPRDVVEVCQALARQNPVGFVTATTGPSNVLASVTCRTSDELFDFVTEQVGGLPGVAQVEVLPLLRRVKEGGSRVVAGRLAPAG